MELEIDNIARVGIVEDISPHHLPPEAWTSGKNIRFQDDKVGKISGHTQVFGTLSAIPYFALPIITPSDYYWIYCGLNAIHSYDGVSHVDLTRGTGGAYAATADFNWNGGILGGIPVLTNGVDVPQFWATPNPSTTNFENVTAWPSGYICKSIVPYKQHLFAMNLTESGTERPHKILWSDLADPGAMPGTWDVSDETADAGETELSDVNSGGIVGGLALGDALVIYKENSMWAVTPRGDQFIFNFDNLQENVGAINARSFVSVPRRRQHIVFTGDDIIQHNGTELDSILTSRLRRNLINSVDEDNFERSFMVLNRQNQEVWFCYPEVNQNFPTKALIYNYETNTLSERDLPEASHIATGFIDENSGASATWDSDGAVWDGDAEVWNSVSANPSLRGLLMLNSQAAEAWKLNTGNQFDGVDYEGYIEKQGIAIIGFTREGRPIVDVQKRKLMRRVWIKATGSPFEVRGISQEEVNGAVAYSPAITFTPGVDRYIDFEEPINGPLLGIRFESSEADSWTISGYKIEYEVLGNF